jgi:YidC/Oxa1 family membrane protein insertase
MERRLLLVFALTFLAIILFEPFLKKYFPEQAATPPAKTQTQAQTSTPSQKLPPPSAAGAIVPQATAATVKPGAPAKSEQGQAETETVIENDFYRIVFTNRGGQVKSWILKKYQGEDGKPLDLVNQAASAKYGYPLSLWTYDESLRNKLNSVLYVPSLTGTHATPAQLTFDYSDQGLTARKTFRFGKSYTIDVDTAVTSKGSLVDALPAWPSGFGDQFNTATYHSGEINYQFNSKIEEVAIKKISGGNTLHGPFDWAGASDAYFTAVFIPQDPQNVALITLRNPLEIPKDPQKPGDTEQVDVVGMAVGNPSGVTSERLYAGPKELRVLQAVTVPTVQGDHQDLRGLVNFGFFGSIARPLFAWLRWTYEHWVPNWGWAIVIQGFIITMALLPLRISQMKSALKMQKVAPQIKSIQEKYKKYSMRDPRKQEMNKEIGEIYKREGVNPIGGCVPMLIQLPFIWAYYKMLEVSIDLRHAHWLWIHDLSARDPLFILPIVMMISMIFMQRMTPQVGMDPAQQKMMNWMMPLMMGFIFFNLSAGLNLYYAESNLIMIGQTAIMNRTSLGREMREMALKRARKQQGKPKVTKTGKS